MGEQLQKVSMKWSQATLQHEAELLNAFSGLVEGRSQLSRVTMKIAWRLVRTVGILRVIEEFVQDKPCETAPDLVAQSLTTEFPSAALESQLGPKPPMRIAPQDGARRRNISVNHRMASCTVMAVSEAMAAYRPLFLGKVSPFNSNTYARVA